MKTYTGWQGVSELAALIAADSTINNRIQYRNKNSPNWYAASPGIYGLYTDIEYCIKPKTKPKTVTLKYRRYLYKGLNNELFVQISVPYGADAGRFSGFVKWLDNDWVTVEVEVDE